MRYFLFLIFFPASYYAYPQCPFAAALASKGGACLGSSTLVASAPGTGISKILWYNGNNIDTVIISGSTAIGITVAGGNGAGNAANQLQEPAGIYMDASGNLYVADAANNRIQKFPVGSTSATLGATVAGGNLAGKAANQLSGPNSVFVDGGGYVYIADEENHRIQKFPPNSTKSTNGKTLFGGSDSGSAGYLLKYPQCVYVDGAGYVYVADAGNNRIQKFTPGYFTAQTVAGGNGIGSAANQLHNPSSVFVDGQGNIYVADFGNNRIQKFPPGSTDTTNGTTVAGGNGQGQAANQLYYPIGVFVDAASNIYVADNANARIQKFPPNSSSATGGVTVAGGNGLGAAPNQLDKPSSVFVDANGNVFVGDAANSRVQKFPPGGANTIDSLFTPTTPGNYTAVLINDGGCTDTTNMVTIYPSVTPAIGITVLANSLKPCTTPATDTVIFTASISNGGTSPTYQWQVNGTNAGTNSPEFTAVLRNGDAVECVLTSNAVCAVPATGQSNRHINTIAQPLTATLSSRGGICPGSDTLVVNPNNSLFKIVWYNGNTADTTIKAHVKYTPNAVTVAGGNGPGGNANQLFAPGSVYVNRDGSFYVSDEQNNRIQRFPAGSTSVSIGTTVAGGNGVGTEPTQLNSPHSTYPDNEGNIYVADVYNNRIQKFPSGSTGATDGITAAGGNGSGMAANQLYAPACAFVDGNGKLYVADQVNNRIQKFPHGSTSLTDGITVAGGNGTGSAANQFNIPYSVFVDGSGNIYVTDQANSRVQKFPPGSSSATNGITVAGGNGQGSAANQLTSPISTYVDGGGNIYVADLGNNRVQEFLPGKANGITVAGGNGRGDATNQLNAPVGVFVDSSGNIFVADQDNDRIQEFFISTSTDIDTAYTPANPGTYIAVVTDTAGCTDTSNAVIVGEIVKAVATVAVDTTTVCAGSPITFTAVAANAGVSPAYQWLVNGAASGAYNANYTTTLLINGDTIACVVSSTAGCVVPDTSKGVIVTIWPLPTVGHATAINILPGKSATLALPVTGNTVKYLWSPPAGLSSDTIANPVASPNQTTTYVLTVESTDGCTAKGEITVTVSYPIILPSAFTPNGDGHNDIFYVQGGYAGELIKDFSVYGRWGQKLFNVENVPPNTPSFGWDGTCNGQPQQPGAYVYIVTVRSASGTDTVYKGTVVLVR